MLARPTTEQLLNDCRRELTEVVLAADLDPNVALSVTMIEDILRSCSVRAAHEIAWMQEESTEMLEYSRSVLEVGSDTEALEVALAAAEAGQNSSLHLDDMASKYSLAGQCLSEAIDVCHIENHDALLALGRELIDRRLANEETIKGAWAFVGRG